MVLLLTHIAFALGSIFLLSAAIITPSLAKINLSYSLIANTLGTGTALVIVTRSPLKSSCIAGITYVAVAATLNVIAHRRLALEQSRD